MTRSAGLWGAGAEGLGALRGRKPPQPGRVAGAARPTRRHAPRVCGRETRRVRVRDLAGWRGRGRSLPPAFGGRRRAVAGSALPPARERSRSLAAPGLVPRGADPAHRRKLRAGPAPRGRRRACAGAGEPSAALLGLPLPGPSRGEPGFCSRVKTFRKDTRLRASLSPLSPAGR